MIYSDTDRREIYCAPFLGNGEITLQITPDGAMDPGMRGKLIKAYPSCCIWWAGRRTRGGSNRALLSFGRFEQKLIAKEELTAVHYTQELDVADAQVKCHTVYGDGSVVDTQVFVRTDCNLIAVKKSIFPRSSLRFSLSYSLCGKGSSECLPDFTVADVAAGKNGGAIHYKLTDQEDLSGMVRFVCDTESRVSVSDNAVTLSREIASPAELCYYIALSDSMDRDDYTEFTLSMITSALADGFGRQKAAHGKIWHDYYAEGGARIGDERCDNAYLTAQYHLKCFKTKWSLPVGLFDSCWESKFFAFDEHYMFLGLLTSNHLDAAACVPRFRADGLKYAISRGSSKHHNAAHYPWETLEDGTEASPPGFWYEHIFHMSTIPLSEYAYYLYTGDLDFLRGTAYPVISACAEFFRIHMLYRVEGVGLIVGKCTDLERLGSSVENAYMTTCGVISTFRIFAEAASLLGCDEELAREYLGLADELMKTLPNDGERYLPYPGCTERSIASYSGTFPFDVIDRSDPLQLAAIEDYVKHEDAFGNMYEMGRGVCSWYACWKAIVSARLGRAYEATEAIRKVAGETGYFGEMFEINNEPSSTYLHPWFTTAAGIYVHAFNECLLSCRDGMVTIAPALAEEYDSFSFRLAAYGGVTIECEAKEGSITRLTAHASACCTAKSVKVCVPERFRTDIVNGDGSHIFTIKVVS